MEGYEDSDCNLQDEMSAEDSFMETDAQINEHIKALEIPIPSQATSSGNANTVRRAKEAARPKIELTFDGSPDKWRRFRGLFTSMIHEEKTLSNAEKMHYLVHALRDAALEVIDSCAANPDAYEDAWQQVVRRYDAPKLLFKRRIEQLFEGEPPTSTV